MGFPFYQGLNPLLNGRFNKDTPLSSGRSILAREGGSPGGPPGPPPLPHPSLAPPAARGAPGAPPHPRDPPSRAFDHLIKGCLYWISHSIMDSTLDKRGNPLNSRSIYWDTQLMIFFLFKFWALYCMCVCLFASLLSRPPGAKINGRHNLLIQGRMQIFKKNIFLVHFKPWDLSRKMRREILIEKDVLNVLRDAFCVELWSFYCKHKNFGPNAIYYVFVLRFCFWVEGGCRVNDPPG